jgi:hypothetical protein
MACIPQSDKSSRGISASHVVRYAKRYMSQSLMANAGMSKEHSAAV